jgi:hypothetical protein
LRLQRCDSIPIAADVGFAGVGRYGLDRKTNAAKSLWLGSSRAGLRGEVGGTWGCANQLVFAGEPLRLSS